MHLDIHEFSQQKFIHSFNVCPEGWIWCQVLSIWKYLGMSALMFLTWGWVFVRITYSCWAPPNLGIRILGKNFEKLPEAYGHESLVQVQWPDWKHIFLEVFSVLSLWEGVEIISVLDSFIHSFIPLIFSTYWALIRYRALPQAWSADWPCLLGLLEV